MGQFYFGLSLCEPERRLRSAPVATKVCVSFAASENATVFPTVTASARSPTSSSDCGEVDAADECRRVDMSFSSPRVFLNSLYVGRFSRRHIRGSLYLVEDAFFQSLCTSLRSDPRLTRSFVGVVWGRRSVLRGGEGLTRGKFSFPCRFSFCCRLRSWRLSALPLLCWVRRSSPSTRGSTFTDSNPKSTFPRRVAAISAALRCAANEPEEPAGWRSACLLFARASFRAFFRSAAARSSTSSSTRTAPPHETVAAFPPWTLGPAPICPCVRAY